MNDFDKDDSDDPRLAAAEGHLKEAEAELDHAKRDVETAIEEVREAAHDEHGRHEFVVTVLYDGVKKPFEVRREELVKTLLDQAISAFGPLPNPHTLALYPEKGGEELKDEQTLKEAGVKPCDLLLLRPSKVKGGAR
jgi:hypothetical protein